MKTFDSTLLKINKLANFFCFTKLKLKGEIEQDLKNIYGLLKREQENFVVLKEELLDKTREVTGLQRDREELIDQILEKEEVEKKLLNLERKFHFIDKILSAEAAPNKGLDIFINLYQNDFLEFANTESSLAEEAEALLLLQSIIQELELAVYYPITATKNIIAIGGGFSSGKSEFVSSFFIEDKIKLPIGLEPVTAIATYVVADKESKILGFSNKGGALEIEPEYYKTLSHNVIKSFGFNLKDIMPFMTIGTPLNEELFSEICLIDTPGYDAANTEGFTQGDKDTAFEFISQAHSLIWMINIENGVINQTDLSFLQELDLQDKYLYIVVNQADLKSQDEIEEIIEEIVDILDDEDIDLIGISAYSSILKREYYFKKTSLLDFLKKENYPIPIETKILVNLDTVFDMYKNAILGDLNKQEKINKSIKSLELDLLQYNGFIDNEMNNKLEGSIFILRNNFKDKNFSQQLKALEKIRKKMKDSIRNIFMDDALMKDLQESAIGNNVY